MLAISLENDEIAEKLLNNEKIDLNIKDNDGWTALMYAQKKNNTEAIELLQKKSGIKPDAEIDNAKKDYVKPTLYASCALTAGAIIKKALKK